MNEKIYVFTGSKKDFESFLDEKIAPESEVTYFMQLIKTYNANLRQEYAYRGGTTDVDNLIVKSDDYASVYEHVIQNFINIVTTNHEVKTTFLHNPPKRVIDALQVSYYDVIEPVGTEYVDITREKLKEIWNKINSNIVGQVQAKQHLISNLYKLCSKDYKKPLVLMLLGDSGIGKTETAKEISNVLGGNLLRIQFSMMQTNEGYNYIFGSEHSKSSFAKDLMARESNIVLIDEFDKVSPTFYNAFYQIFDEGLYIDTNYCVDVSRCVFLCTTNFMNDKEVIEKLGMPIFSRFDDFIKYEYLTDAEKLEILSNLFKTYTSTLSEEEKTIIDKSNIYEWHKQNISRFKNVRIIKSRLEKAINDLLVNAFIIE